MDGQSIQTTIPSRSCRPDLSGWAKPCTILLFVLGGVQSANAQYTESYQAWSATTADTWETQDLSGAPFNVPANAVVEVAMRNANTSQSRSAGVRAVGSSLERRFDLDVPTGGGVDVVVMHVQTDASSQIEHYADDTTDVDFVLLGYWECGIYVGLFDTFTSSSTWTDQDLNVYGLGPSDIAEIVITNGSNPQDYDAGVRTNGSTLERRVLLQAHNGGKDAVSMFVQADNSGSATIETFAGNISQVVFHLVGYWSVAPGRYTETFTDIGSPSTDATWEDIDLTASGAPDDSVAEILFANNVTTDENEIGVRSNGSSQARLFDLRQKGNGDGDFGRMHVQSDAAAVIEFYHEDVSDAHSFHMIGYWRTGAILKDHDAGQVPDAFTAKGGETNAEMYAFKLTPCSGTLTVTEMVFRLTDIVGLTDGDWAGIELLIDDNDNGQIDAGETTAVGGVGVVDTAAGTVTFSSSFDISTGVHFILRADFASLSLGDQVTIVLDKDDVTASGPITGVASSVTHLELCYVEAFEAWTATTPDVWETIDLSGAPFSVPSGAVVEIAVRNSNTSNERWGGVREVGSALERRLQLHEAEGGGYDVLVMHVQTNSNSELQHYTDATADVDFVLLGYWTCGTYVELFDTFAAGADASWQNRDLCTYGVGPGHAAEFLLANGNADNEREAGVRTNGSILERRLNLHEAEDGGVDAVTTFVKADTTINATVELYAQVDADIDFYLIGYWSVAPLAYNELFANIGSPTADATWEDVDLTAGGVVDNAVAEIVLANQAGTSGGGSIPNEMGVRANGSTLDRLLDFHEAEDGGSDLGRMTVQTDETATIEFYHEDVSDAHAFQLVGYWTKCDSSIAYIISDLGAITPTQLSIGQRINSTRKVAGFEEDTNSAPDAWMMECGTFSALGTLGGSDAEAHDINESDMVVGWAHDGNGDRRAFTWTSGGGMINLGITADRDDSEAQAVNNSSEVVGTLVNFGSPSSGRLAFIYLPAPAYTLGAGMTSLGTLGGDESIAADINDTGQVVGGAQDFSGNYRPFRWQNGTMSDLGTLGGDSVRPDHRAQAINNSGDIAGRSYTAGGAAHAFLWDGGMTDLGVLSGGTQSWAFGINEDDVVVGTSDVAAATYRAFIWDSVHGMRNLNDLIPAGSGWTLIRATDINDEGFITGWGKNGSGDTRAFMLTPSCSGGGGAAAAFSVDGDTMLGFTRGKADANGDFNGVIASTSGTPLAEVTLTKGVAGADIEVTVYMLMDGFPVADPQTLPGFNEGASVDRLLHVELATVDERTTVTVRMTVSTDELVSFGMEPQELELYLSGSEAATGAPVWKPAGTSVGENAPTTAFGESGVLAYDDGSADYWAVTNGSGWFAIGKRSSADDQTQDVARPSMCGAAMMLPLILCGFTLFLCRVRQRHGDRT